MIALIIVTIMRYKGDTILLDGKRVYLGELQESIKSFLLPLIYQRLKDDFGNALTEDCVGIDISMPKDFLPGITKSLEVNVEIRNVHGDLLRKHFPIQNKVDCMMLKEFLEPYFPNAVIYYR